MNETASPALRPAWVEVDLSAIESNTRLLKTRLGEGVELMAMVKANAYGHGAVESARAALRGGATWLGVYAAGEGVELRQAGVTAPILVLGPTLTAWARVAVEYDLAVTLASLDTAEALAAAAAARGATARVHVKVDTGMARLGVTPAEAPAFVRALAALPALTVEGLCTHFSVADSPDARGIPGWGRAYTERQLETFLQTAAAVEAGGIALRYRHAANSPGALYFPAARLNLVRSGILLYGLEPSAEAPRPPGFRPALAFKTRVAEVRAVPRGSFVSYGATFETGRDSLIAVIMCGYADGFRRAPRNWGCVLLHGRRVPLAGRVCMDQAMLDATGLPGVAPGDEVVLIGRQGDEELSAEEVAGQLGTNNYEVVTTISARVPRLYRRTA